MKKNFFRIALIALAAMLVITGCSADGTPTVTTRTITVKGSANVVATPATASTKALSRAAGSNQGEFASGEFKINNVNKADELKPTAASQELIDAAKPGDKLNNIEFEIEVEAGKTTTLEAAPEVGYIFDEWEVKKDCPADIEDIIEDYLEKNGLEKSPRIQIPTEYVEWLAPEYDNGYYVIFGEKAEGETALTLEELSAMLADYKEDELTIVIKGDATEDNINALNDAIATVKTIEELKIVSNGTVLTTTEMDVTFEEIEYKGFTFSNDLTINFKNPVAPVSDEEDEAEYEVEFKNCAFQNVTVEIAAGINAKEIEVEFDNCSMKKLTLNNKSTVTAEGELDGKSSTYDSYETNGNWKFEIDDDVKQNTPAPEPAV